MICCLMVSAVGTGHKLLKVDFFQSPLAIPIYDKNTKTMWLEYVLYPYRMTKSRRTNSLFLWQSFK